MGAVWSLLSLNTLTQSTSSAIGLCSQPSQCTVLQGCSALECPAREYFKYVQFLQCRVPTRVTIVLVLWATSQSLTRKLMPLSLASINKEVSFFFFFQGLEYMLEEKRKEVGSRKQNYLFIAVLQ